MESPRSRWRGLLPWVVSAALLAYVFGWLTDWERLRAATEQANLPLFLAFATADRMAFFVIWTWLTTAALRRFVVHVQLRSVLALRGGSELARAVSNPLSDAAFFLGLVSLTAGRLDAVLAAALVPAVSHLVVMLVQMTLALPFLEGGLAANSGVATAAAVAWIVLACGAVALWLSRSGRISYPGVRRASAWLERFPPRQLLPFLGGFTVLALFDIQIQWLASRAFGVEIGWLALAARIPVVYLTFAIPTLGNYGTREVAWAAMFSDFAERDALVAYAFAINTIFLVLNVLLGVTFLGRALELLRAVRRARREGQPLPRPILHDPTDG